MARHAEDFPLTDRVMFVMRTVGQRGPIASKNHCRRKNGVSRLEPTKRSQAIAPLIAVRS